MARGARDGGEASATNDPDFSLPEASASAGARGATARNHGRPALQVVVLPRLWAPMHHHLAVTALTSFVGNIQPDAVAFLNPPGPEIGEMWQAFTGVLEGFRAVYEGPILTRFSDNQRVRAADLAALRVSVIAPLAPIAPGWLAGPDNPMQADGGVIGCAQQAGSSLVCGGTGRLRITGRAAPAKGGGSDVWLVFECGSLAEDRHTGTLGFGVLEDNAGDIKAYPVRIDADGAFTLHGIRHSAR
ncbi:hypothetical protein GCM10023321_63720 [Pseudonocardia eucalypti]|uniref:Uncharacterized protein n=1 Tax=Pseudonocardia eucalypti TaxID=648755 RepID=A0ABP9QXG9_9PSEU|nr:hypothetical protein [Pseudonocardia eucalypti]